jgi:hypothetical protein
MVETSPVSMEHNPFTGVSINRMRGFFETFLNLQLEFN